ncbi:MAG: YvrJ family protein [Bacillota bacterium]
MDDLWQQIANVGFPIAVAIYLLVRVEKKIDDLTIAIVALGESLKR